MFEAISRGFNLALSSWKVLYTDKKLIIFPIITGLTAILVLASFIVPIGVLAANGAFDWLKDEKEVPGWFWAAALGVMFLYYFVSYFVIIFFNAALVSCALQRFNGQEPTIVGGLGAAAARLPQILGWSLVSATVGMLLKLIEMSHKEVGKFVSAILGTAWTILTYFVVPVLVVEKVGPFTAISRSVALLRQTWGEGLVGSFSLALFQFLLFLPGILLLIGGGALCAQAPDIHVSIGITVLVIGALYMLLAFAISAALDTIFLTALYQYAAFKQVPQGFEPSSIEGAFRKS